MRKKPTTGFEHEHGELSSREADLDTREATLEEDRKSLGDMRVGVLAYELVAELKESSLKFRERELADKQK
jgi:hypothetical protein